MYCKIFSACKLMYKYVANVITLVTYTIINLILIIMESYVTRLVSGILLNRVKVELAKDYQASTVHLFRTAHWIFKKSSKLQRQDTLRGHFDTSH